MSFFIGEYAKSGMMTRSLEEDARKELKKWQEIKRQAATLDKLAIIKGGERLESFVKAYTEYHKECKRESKALENRRQDHWDILNKKCSESPMFKDLWDELMLLLKLEKDAD